MSDTYVYSGATSSGLVLNSGETEYVYSWRYRHQHDGQQRAA